MKQNRTHDYCNIFWGKRNKILKRTIMTEVTELSWHMCMLSE